MMAVNSFLIACRIVHVAGGSGNSPRIASAIGSDRKGNLSLVPYLLVAAMWFVPDKRIADTMGAKPDMH